jgi:hypothetical protein
MDLVSTWADISNDTEKNASVDVSGCGGTALCMAAALNERGILFSLLVYAHGKTYLLI